MKEERSVKIRELLSEVREQEALGGYSMIWASASDKEHCRGLYIIFLYTIKYNLCITTLDLQGTLT